MSAPFRQVDERLVHQGHVVSFHEVGFEGPDGERFQRDVVRHPGAVSVVPVLADGRVVMVRQFRAAIGGDLLEVPAGKRDVAGEEPELTARRELVEEVGYVAGTLTLLARICHSPGFCDEVNHIFLATDLEPTERSVDGPEEEHMTIELLPLADAFGAIARGEVTDAKSVVGLTLAAHHLGVVVPRS